MTPVYVLLVDDDPAFLEAIRESLALTEEFILDCALSAEQALEKLSLSRYDVIVSDYSMPDMDGVDLLIQIRTFSNIPFILFTGKDDENVVIDAINSGVDFYLKKGEDHEILLAELAYMIRQGAYKKQLVDQLTENEQKFRELFEKSSIATIIYNSEGILVDINPTALSLLHISSGSDVKGLSLFQHHELSEETITLLNAGETIRSIKVVNFDAIDVIRSQSGRGPGTKYIDISFIPHKRADGSISAYYVQIIDLTAQHHAEDNLRETSEQLSLALEGSRIGLWDWKVPAGETTYSERWAEILGYSLAELTPTTLDTWMRLTHPDDLKRANELIQKHFSGELPFYESVIRMRHKDGHWVYVLDRGRVTERDPAGSPLRMIGTHTDISKQKEAERAIKEKTEEIDQFFSVTLEMLCIANSEGYFTLLNPAWELVLGWNRSELMAEKFLDFVHPDDIDATLAALSDLADQKKVINFVNRYRCRDGTYRWLEWRSAPVNHKIYAAARDITERRENEERLIRKKNILDAISFAATCLMSSLSDDTITMVLSRIGKAVEVSRTYIFIHSYTPEGRSVISQRYEWVSEGTTPQIDNPLLQHVHWQKPGYERWASVLTKGGVIYGNVKDFPKEEQPILIDQDIKSLAEVPIFSHDEFLGFIGFDNCITEHEWNPVELETLEAAAGLIGASLGRRKAEEEVMIRETNFATFFNTIDDFLFVLDSEGMIEKVNETVMSRLGYREDELIGQSVLIIHPESRRTEAVEKINEILAGTSDFCMIPIITKDGRQIPVETRVVPGVWNGYPALFGVSKDISAITVSEEKFSKAFQSGGALMAISILETGEFVAANKSFLESLGYSREEVIGKSAFDLRLFVDPDIRAEITEEIKEHGSSRNRKVQVRTRDNHILTGIFSADIIRIQDTDALLTVMNDVTEIIRLSDALLQANRKLNLLSSITRHDILNQVQALFFVQGFLERKIPINSPAREELILLNKTVETIYSQILFTKDYQDMGIEAPAWVSIEAIIEKERANKIFSDLTIVVTTGDLEVFADPMFSKVCFNLMENSLRHGERVTRITISFIETPQKGLLIFEDDGVGVAQAEKPMIFRRGVGKNTGLGLFLTTEILSISGMTIQETGEEGKGARFEISVPLNGFRHGGKPC